MKTQHQIINNNSKSMSTIPDKSVQLIVTSPPYPMIEMWDSMFFEQDRAIQTDFDNKRYNDAFEKMHCILDLVWEECDRVLSDNGFVCINIGDATRTFDGNFQLFSNHARIINTFLQMGYCVLPDIHWRKQSNAPNKFMGSGMYPAGAYVTYEHEYILVFRKGEKREFKGSEKAIRQESAYFWEERNIWFSDLWEIKGATQTIKNSPSRGRNASYPLEIPYRLVNMYSVKGDTVLDPFCGLATTTVACMVSQRNSIGVEIDKDIFEIAQSVFDANIEDLNHMVRNRCNRHIEFIENLPPEKKDKCYLNNHHGFLVKTRQETALALQCLAGISKNSEGAICSYE